MGPAIIGLIGAAIGAVTALIGAALTDRRQSRNEERRWRRDQRSTAYAETLRYLLRANRVSGQDYSVSHAMQDDPDWIKDLIEAQYWMRILTMRCSPEQAGDVNLLAFRLDEAIGLIDSGFKRSYMQLILQTCIDGVVDCARSDTGVGFLKRTTVVKRTTVDDADPAPVWISHSPDESP